MPGYTIDAFRALGLTPGRDGRWCSHCRLWWKNRGFQTHWKTILRKRKEERRVRIGHPSTWEKPKEREQPLGLHRPKERERR